MTNAASTKTKEAVMTAAVDLFMTRGYNGTSVRAVADEAKVNVALISYYFGGKKGLLETILNDYLIGYLEAIEDGIRRETSSFDRLLAMIESAMEYQRTHHRKARLVLREMTLDSMLVREVMASYFMKEKHYFSLVYEQGRKQGVFTQMRKEWAILHLRGMITMPFLHAQYIREVFHLEPNDDTFVMHYMKHVKQFIELQLCTDHQTKNLPLPMMI
ncbi:forespore capture DNA-binding protein RefZ [Geomicrobium sediminis]|uniref:AcrR family transcriptional regulator n=1 Tax=Geomicrobium sediminis TaxID=1347788 RepID=A0ABS2P8X4_9BACL|nr:forespore capture DNA-binding protein RefZ [Geomicrobium sediminis]MBM7631845.1 AcrR family transcriptional regulator [Geomicrobium sediminis]